jgi:hypothetical protein
MLEAIATLGLIRGQAALAPDASGSRIGALTRELRSELEIQDAARREVEALLD